MEESLQNDYKQCQDIIKKNSKTFYMAFDQLPTPKKEAVWAFYAWNRRVDDLGDESKDVLALKEEESAFDRLMQGDVKQDFVYRALAHVNESFPIDQEAIYAMFRGQYKDALNHSIQTEEELLEYCFEVAGSVGHMLLPILASKNYITHKEELKESAKAIGIGMQITNILRDVLEDFEQNRVYFPKVALDTYKVDLEDLIGQIKKNHINIHKHSHSYVELWEYYAEKARMYYNKGLEKIELYDEDSQRILGGAVYLYAEILEVVRQNGYGLVKEVKVSKARKLALLNELMKKEAILWKISGSH